MGWGGGGVRLDVGFVGWDGALWVSKFPGEWVKTGVRCFFASLQSEEESARDLKKKEADVHAQSWGDLQDLRPGSMLHPVDRLLDQGDSLNEQYGQGNRLL